MKREEKNAQSKRRILDAAMREFSERGYETASLNTVCAENDISKGIIYHYFKDKDELYLLCVKDCFDAITLYLQTTVQGLSGSAEQRLQSYFDARLRFFMENPLFLGLFVSATLGPPEKLRPEIAECRKDFDALNISILADLLYDEPLRKGLSITNIIDDFIIYMDFFNMRFKTALGDAGSDLSESILREHEEKCHRQLDILLHGVLERNDVRR